MRKSTSLVGILGALVGLSVAVLPSVSFAATKIVSEDVEVSLSIDKYLALEHISGAQGEGVTYDDATHTYSATLQPGSTKPSFGTSTFRVTCNYLAAPAPQGVETPAAQSARLADDCSHGWVVNAASSTETDISGVKYATMTSLNNSALNPAVIVSKDGTLAGSESNWQMSTAGVAKSIIINGISYNTTAPAAENSYGSLRRVPAKTDGATVISGNTFQKINNVPNTYINTQDFTVSYGVSAGGATPADTYTGTITYTLSIKAAS